MRWLDLGAARRAARLHGAYTTILHELLFASPGTTIYVDCGSKEHAQRMMKDLQRIAAELAIADRVDFGQLRFMVPQGSRDVTPVLEGEKER